MIFDNLRNLGGFELPNGIRALLEWGQKVDMASLSDGRHELRDGCFCLVQRYDTKPESEALFEAHRKYIDIQLVRSGRERMLMADVGELTIESPYEAGRDAGFYTGHSRVAMEFSAGDYAVFYPSDAHMSSLDPVSGRSQVEKLVLKLPVE